MNCKAIYLKRGTSDPHQREGDDLFYTLHVGALSAILVVAIVSKENIMIYPTVSDMLYPTASSGFIDQKFFDTWFAGLKPGRYVSAELCMAYKRSYAKTGMCVPASGKINTMLRANGCTFLKSNGIRLTFKPSGPPVSLAAPVPLDKRPSWVDDGNGHF